MTALFHHFRSDFCLQGKSPSTKKSTVYYIQGKAELTKPYRYLVLLSLISYHGNIYTATSMKLKDERHWAEISTNIPRPTGLGPCYPLALVNQRVYPHPVKLTLARQIAATEKALKSTSNESVYFWVYPGPHVCKEKWGGCQLDVH